MKKIQFGLIIFLLFSINTFSQEGKQKGTTSPEVKQKGTTSPEGKQKQFTPEERAEKITEWMKTNLNLTEAQIQPVTDINLKYAKKNEELKASTADRKVKFKQLKSNEKAREDELKKVLTKEQIKIYQAKKNELKKMIEEKSKEHGKAK